MSLTTSFFFLLQYCMMVRNVKNDGEVKECWEGAVLLDVQFFNRVLSKSNILRLSSLFYPLSKIVSYVT